MIKIIIKIVIVFILSFLCFNQGMNNIFEDYAITPTNITMVILPFIALILVTANEIYDHTENNVKQTKRH